MMRKYFMGSIVFSFLGILGAIGVGYYYNPSMIGALNALFIVVILSVLEISLSFDNAIVNAIILKKMTPLWRHRFLTWGMWIAVFGMRLVFPLMIVTIVAHVNPWEALVMAAARPNEYAALMLKSHLEVAAFGGAFLMMVALKYFYDENKKVHWIHWLEKIASGFGRIEAIEIGITLTILLSIGQVLPAEEKMRFLTSGLVGLIVFILVDGIAALLEASEDVVKNIHKAGAGLFLYLEVLDASFSFDGVVGAFAITHNLFIIMIGLSIGAFFVRSLTILFVEENTLSQYRYLEHGAFYAIGILAGLMLLDVVYHIPEWITGLLGGLVIVTSFFWSAKFDPNEVEGKRRSK